jgi:hypothetical protein
MFSRMRSSEAFRRIIAAVAGLWLTIALVEPVGLHACPMHDALHGGHSVAAASTGGSAVVGASPEAEAPDPHHHHHNHGAPNGHSTGDARAAIPDHSDGDAPHAAECLCLGSCCAASVVAVPDAVATETVVLVAEPRATPVGPTAAPRSLGGVVLPFANGPPAAR